MDGMMGGGHGAFGGVGLILNLVITIGVIILVVVLIIWAVRRLSADGSGSSLAKPSGATPKEVLQLRYSRGEITRDQYQEILADLDLT
ncbi:MAG: SHOCT domain-containing protein [Anaerolineales bacterium]